MPSRQREPLQDGHGRPIGDLRVSVTDRCNFRCQYCMPADGLEWLEREEILSFEEVHRLVSLLVELGVEDVRLTGGEPLVRRQFPRLVAMLAGIDGIRDLSLTTNGYLLERHAGALVEAGIQRVNVSIDSLERDRFFRATRRDALARVLDVLRPLTPGAVVTVFGCGGDRDRGKRPEMGEAAARRSDLVVLTSDNPRTEDPARILADVEVGVRAAGMPALAHAVRGARGYVVEPDRTEAIRLAVNLARPGDLVLVAGKGHEDYQIVGHERRHLDDREEVRRALEERR